MPRRTEDGKELSGAARRKLKADEARAELLDTPWAKADRRAFRSFFRRRYPNDAAGQYQQGLDLQQLVLRRIAQNPDITPQQRHGMLGQHNAGHIRALDAGRIIQQQGQELREAHTLVQSLKAKLHAATTAARGQGGAEAGTVN